ncbi:MAG: uroporphyrinogen-III synthase [Gammaproteobacteria bacterium]
MTEPSATGTATLAGRCVWITRPEAQAESLCLALTALGAEVVAAPTLQIIAPEDRTVAIAALQQLENSPIAIFVSRNAVDWSQQLLVDQQLSAVLGNSQVLAVGPATGRALQNAGVVTVTTPAEGADSEALLALPALQHERVREKQVAIVRGTGGRELLADTLQKRAAKPVFVEVYQRVVHAGTAARMPGLWQSQPPAAIVVSSAMGLQALLQMTPVQYQPLLLDCRLLALGRHLPAQADALGFKNCLPVSASCGDSAVISALQTL